jgi:hypothetical protein
MVGRYNVNMACDSKTPNPAGHKGNPTSAIPVTMNQLVDSIFKIKPDDVKRIVGSKPGKGRKKS